MLFGAVRDLRGRSAPRASTSKGSFSLAEDGWPLSALLKVAFSRPRDGENAYSSKANGLSGLKTLENSAKKS